jgi:hypothetical protein
MLPLGCAQVDGSGTFVVLERPLVTCDVKDHPIDVSVPQYMVWAYGARWGIVLSWPAGGVATDGTLTLSSCHE